MNFKHSPRENKYLQINFLFLFPLALIILYIMLGAFWQSLPDILNGLYRIFICPSQLNTDYIAIGGLGATLWNSALFIMFQLLIICLAKIDFTANILAATILTSAFAFQGTNLLNSLPLFIGAYLYIWTAKLSLAANLSTIFFSSVLAPLVSVTMFGLNLPLYISIPLAIIIGLVTGMIIPLLASKFITFHKGYNLFNIGFVAGIIGLTFVSFFRLFGYKINTVNILSSLNLTSFIIILILFFLFMMIIGFFLNDKSLKNYPELLTEKGNRSTDFNALYGSGLTLFNMGLMGLVCFIYLLLIGAPFNGIVLCSVLSIVGFAAIGIHPWNAIPLMLGVYLATSLNPGLFSPTTAATTAIFATGISAVTGIFGVLAGLFAGFLHASIVPSLSVLHGGLNQYNNGFSLGFVAAILVPILTFLQAKRKNN